MAHTGKTKSGRPAATCPECGGSVREGRSSILSLATALVLAGSVLSFYLVGLPLLAAGVGMAVKRDRCVCETG